MARHWHVTTTPDWRARPISRGVAYRTRAEAREAAAASAESESRSGATVSGSNVRGYTIARPGRSIRLQVTACDDADCIRVPHWHVMQGIPGYLPDTNEVARTLTEARQYARQRAEWAREEEYIVRGNMRDGYEYLPRDASPYYIPRYISVEQCHEADCERGD